MVVMPAMMPETAGPYPTDVCAVVLAAGEGARLRPLTLLRPKLLCPVDGTPLVDLALERAATAVDPGAVAVNLFHGREALATHLDGRAHLSVEQGEARGTAGALGVLRPWIDGRGVLVLNGDTWAPGDLAPFVAGWDRERVRILVAGDDHLGPASRIAGACMPWAEVARLATSPSGLWEVSWRYRLSEGRVEVVRWDGPWVDCGTPAQYLAANMAASGGAPVVGDGAEVRGRLDGSVVWAGARVRAGETLVHAIRADDYMTVLVR
jgi:N-acetyl-alpha-D-muramate 1-phosphate uridylyltransferase